MLFTVELKGMGLGFRLQKNETWREYTSDDKLQESDFTCTTAADVTNRSNIKGMFEINGETYEVNPSLMELGSSKKYLNYSSSMFRQIYPEKPTLAQLKSTIASGDDSTNNCLILNVQGNFELKQAPPFNQLINDPSIVLRHETFTRDNDYVGSEAAADDELMRYLFTSSLEYWKKHLKYHTTHEYSDTRASKTLEQIQEELEELRKNWQPDY